MNKYLVFEWVIIYIDVGFVKYVVMKYYVYK